MNHKRLTTLLILLSALTSWAQISVVDFKLDKEDITALHTAPVLDQNGYKCALIRVQTTQDGFIFDTGRNLPPEKIDYSPVGEVWVYVPYGVRQIMIAHPQLGRMDEWYTFPVPIEKACTYVMKISHDKIFVNQFDESHKKLFTVTVSPSNAELTINGVKTQLDASGRVQNELAYGTHTYRVVAEGYYPRDGQFVVGDNEPDAFDISNLDPIMGSVSVHATPAFAKVLVDGQTVANSNIDPHPLQIGKHKVRVECKGYRPEEKVITISENVTEEVIMQLSQQARFEINTSPSGAQIRIGDKRVGTSPCSEVLTTGDYMVQATKRGYKDYSRTMHFDCADPSVKINLTKIYNPKNEFYIEGNVCVGGLMAFGGTMGCYISNFNIEGSYMFATGKSEDIYWNAINQQPVKATYSPNMNVGGKVGYGIPMGTRARLTPQLGFRLLKLKEDCDTEVANGASVASGSAGMRLSVAVANCIGISLAPEILFPVGKSKGYEKLEPVSSKIKKWGQGFNVRLGLVLFFN